MKTILLISPYWREAHRWMVSTVKLAELWQRIGYKVVVVCMGSKNDVERVSDTLEIHRRKDFFIPDPWNYGIAPGFSGYTLKLARKLKPDVIVANKILFWSSLAVIRLKLSGHRVVLLTDALVGITWWPRGLIPKISSAIYAWTLGWIVMLCADRFVTFFPQPKAVLSRLGVSKKTTVIPTGIDSKGDWAAPDKKKKDTVTITYVGRLESVKGVDDFLAAVVPLKQANKQLHIQVVGWYKDNHPLVERYERDVRFTGLREDIRAILTDTDIFVLPSYSEGLSNALMEAMACQCACIATDVGGNAYLLQNGVSGLLFPPGDRPALSAHIQRLLDDPAKRTSLQTAARKRIEDVFSWEQVAGQYKQFFESL